MRAVLLLSTTLAALLAACGHAGDTDSLFPLAGGHQWTYRVTTAWEGDTPTEHDSLTLRTLGTDTPEGLRADVATWRRRSDSGVDYWLREDASGIYRVASKSDADEAALPDTPPRYVLKAPYTAGTQWQAGTTPYLLMRNSEFPRELRHTHRNVPMQYQIEAGTEALDTPAGHFEHCLRVKGVATVRVYADPTAGWKDLPLVTREWYCRGVGLARLERQEAANSPFLTGGTMTMELESWQ